MLHEKSVWVLDAKTIECPNIQTSPSIGAMITQYHTVSTSAITVPVVAVPNSFVFIDVDNFTPLLTFNVSTDVSALSLGDKVFICFRYSNVDVNYVANATMLPPTLQRYNFVQFIVSNRVAFQNTYVGLPRYLLELTFDGTNLMSTYEFC
jgi:hypothetical protein